MRTYIVKAVFFACILTGCGNGGGNNDNKSEINLPEEDSSVVALADLSADTAIHTLLCQNWENREDAEDAALSGSGEGLEMPYRGLSFFRDGSVVENPRDKLRFGSWKLDEANKEINIEFNKSGRAKYKIVAIGAKQMILMNMADKKQTEYRADAKAHLNPLDDPFHASNNVWRVKPVKPEADTAIKSRTEQCVLFYAKFLEDNAGRGGNIISFAGLPTCFKWYRGGVSVIAGDKVEQQWLNCYYSNAQAMKGHAMLESIISKKYKWNKEEPNWVKQSAGVVRQMYDTLRLL